MNGNIDDLLDRCLNYEEMMELCRAETRERISDVLRLCLPHSDTPEGRILLEEQLYGILIQMLTLLQVGTRKLRKEKQTEGIEAAKAKGIHFGRKQKYDPDDYIAVFQRLEKGEIDSKEAIMEIGSSPNTFYRMHKALKAEGKI